MKCMIYRDQHDDNMYHVAMPYKAYGNKIALYHFAAVHRDAISDIGGDKLISQLDEYKPGEIIEVNLSITMEE